MTHFFYFLTFIGWPELIVSVIQDSFLILIYHFLSVPVSDLHQKQ